MIKIENTETFGWEAAIRGMRNPLNSWDKSDSYPAVDCGKCGKIEREGTCKKEDRDCTGFECYEIGPNDLGRMKNLCNAGADHRKFMRMIVVWADITAPLYWWKQFDTYKVGTVRNSCSTMHKIHAKEFDISDFSVDRLYDKNINLYEAYLIPNLNYYRNRYSETKNPDDWYQLIQLLPDTYIQKATVMLNYEVLLNMHHSRKNHKLDEWHDFCDWIESLPYSELITGEDRKFEYANQPGLANAAQPIFQLGC